MEAAGTRDGVGGRGEDDEDTVIERGDLALLADRRQQAVVGGEVVGHQHRDDTARPQGPTGLGGAVAPASSPSSAQRSG